MQTSAETGIGTKKERQRPRLNENDECKYVVVAETRSTRAGFASEDESLFDGYRGDSGLMTEVQAIWSWSDVVYERDFMQEPIGVFMHICTHIRTALARVCPRHESRSMWTGGYSSRRGRQSSARDTCRGTQPSALPMHSREIPCRELGCLCAQGGIRI
jgi:hypothetical protein